MSENPGGTPPQDGEPVQPVEPTVPPTPAEDAAAEPAVPVAPDEPAAAAPTEPEPLAAAAEPEPPAVPAQPEPPAPPVPPQSAYVPPAAPSYAPPPQGAYPPPSQGAYPPPPQGAYPPPAGGYPSAPPPAGGYPAAPPSPLGAAFSYGWNAFTRSGGVFIAATLIWLVAGAVVLFLVSLAFGGLSDLFNPDGDSPRVGLSLGLLVLGAVFYLIVYLVQATFVRVSLKVTKGGRPELADFFSFENSTNVILAALLVTAINIVVSLVSWIPLIGQLIALAVNLFILFTLWFVVDKNLTPVEAVKSSIALVRANFTNTLVFYLLSVVILIAGAVLCGIGLLIAAPVVLVATSYFYRHLLGEPVAPLA